MAAAFFLSAGASEENAGEATGDMNRFRNLFPEWVKCVAIVSPASPGQTGEVDLGIALLKQAGIQVVVMPHAREHENSGYSTIEAEKRAADLETAWLDPRVDLILCTRGGIGSEDMVDKLDWEKLARRKDMPVVGFIECPGRKPSVVENALNKMRERGCFRKCAGIVFGHFVNCGPPGEIEEVLCRFTGTVDCPVFAGFPYGHRGSNRMLDFRRKVVIGEDGILVFEKPQKNAFTRLNNQRELTNE